MKRRIVVLCGLSIPLFDKIYRIRNQFLARTQSGLELEKLLGVCLPPVSDFNYEAMFGKLAKTVFENFEYSSQSRYADTGVIALWFVPRDFELGSVARDLAFTYSIVHRVENTATPHSTSRNNIRQIADLCRRELRYARGVMSHIRVEVQDKDSRTPLLLPIENFVSHTVRDGIARLPIELASGDRGTLSSRFERLLAELMIKADPETGEHQTVFVDKRGMRFEAPSKAGARHGAPHPLPPHSYSCFLKSHLRLGVPYHCEFHYDVTERGGHRVDRDMPDCHGSTARRLGRPHANVCPSDFIR